MAKADRVHSTPRKTASKVQRKKAKNMEPLTDDARATLYGALENPICECARMADIAAEAQIQGADYKDFALFKLCEMVSALREIYYGGEAGPIVQTS